MGKILFQVVCSVLGILSLLLSFYGFIGGAEGERGAEAINYGITYLIFAIVFFVLLMLPILLTRKSKK